MLGLLLGILGLNVEVEAALLVLPDGRADLGEFLAVDVVFLLAPFAVQDFGRTIHVALIKFHVLMLRLKKGWLL